MKKVIINLIQYWVCTSIVSFLGSMFFTAVLHFFPQSNCTIIALVFCVSGFASVGLAFITAIIYDIIIAGRRRKR